MKKLLLISSLLIALIIQCAFAEDIDLSGLSVNELKTLRDRIDTELLRRNPPAAGDVICDEDFCYVVLSSWSFDESEWFGKTLTLNCEWTNRKSKPYYLGEWVSVSVSSGDRTLGVSRRGMYEIIKANSSYAFDIEIEVPSWADSIVVEFYSFYTPSHIYKTFTFIVP